VVYSSACAASLVRPTWPLCAPSFPVPAADYLALVALRTTLHSLEKLELGTDALVWAVNAFRISFEEAVKIVDYLIALTCPVEIPGRPGGDGGVPPRHHRT
jgi:hypothetical protein